MAERTAWRICSQLCWWSAFGKSKRGKAKMPGPPPVHDDLCAVTDEKGRVRHEFGADAPTSCGLRHQRHRTDEGKLYLGAIKDAYSNWIVGYSIDSRMKSRLGVAALKNAVVRRGDVAGSVVHSDAGSQGGLNRSSQHLDGGGVRWAFESVSGECIRIEGRFPRRIDRPSRGGRIGSGSGPRL